jgi:hypothetical protein
MDSLKLSLPTAGVMDIIKDSRPIPIGGILTTYAQNHGKNPGINCISQLVIAPGYCPAN